MSSNYEVICLNHDPAQMTWGSHPTADQALADARQPNQHPRCDLLIARFSGGLVEVGCPAMPRTDNTPTARPHAGWHRDTNWVDAGWLRLLVTAYTLDTPPDPLVKAALDVGLCWQPERIVRIRYILTGEGQ